MKYLCTIRNLSLLLLIATTCPAHADDWPQWRGANREGIWRETGIVDNLPARGLPVRWRTSIGAGFAGPAVAAGRVYLMDRVLDADAPADLRLQWNYRDKTRGRERVVCLDAATGKQLWLHQYPCEYSIAYGSGPRATPTVAGGKVYTLGAMGDLFCLDAATGKVVWQKNFVRDYGAEVPIYGCAAAPLVDRERLIAVVGGEGPCRRGLRLQYRPRVVEGRQRRRSPATARRSFAPWAAGGKSSSGTATH